MARVHSSGGNSALVMGGRRVTIGAGRGVEEGGTTGGDFVAARGRRQTLTRSWPGAWS
jgi:hypothetical protein